MKRHPLPLWLRKLGRVKKELKAMRWPSSKEGFHQGLALMAMGLKTLKDEQDLIAFSKGDFRRIRRWRKERARVFPSPNRF